MQPAKPGRIVTPGGARKALFASCHFLHGYRRQAYDLNPIPLQTTPRVKIAMVGPTVSLGFLG